MPKTAARGHVPVCMVPLFDVIPNDGHVMGPSAAKYAAFLRALLFFLSFLGLRFDLHRLAARCLE